jgi:glycosyltransferase involved in cell wall biosynthesis
MPHLLVFSNDPLKAYVEKGEIKERYYNSGDFFDKITLCCPGGDEGCGSAIQPLFGKAEYAVVPLEGLRSPFFLLLSRRWIKNFAAVLRDRAPFDCVRAYNARFQGLGAARMAKHHGIPLVLSIHTEPDEQRLYEKKRNSFWRNVILQLLVFMEKRVLSSADLVLAVTEHVARYCRKRGAQRVEVLYNKVDLENFRQERPCPGEMVGLEKPIFLSVGRHDFPKRQDLIIQAFSKLSEGSLVLIGQGAETEKLKNLASSLGVGERTLFIPSVNNKEIPGYYQHCDVVVQVSEYEGFGIPVAEALAAGKPVIANDIPPFREILEGAENACLVPLDRKDLEEAMETLFSQGAYGKTGMPRVCKRAFSFDSMALEGLEKEKIESLMASREVL